MKKIYFTIAVLFLLSACTVIRELVTFSKCEFRLKSVQEVKIAGINLNNKTSLKDFNFSDLASITQAVIRGSVPMNFYVDVEAKNPNSQNASIDKIEWIALVDDKEIVNGSLDQRIIVPANNGVTTIPLKFSIDLIKISNSSTAKSLAELALSVMNIGNHNSRLTIKIKPSITVGSFMIDYPGYISVTKEFSSGN